MPGVRLTSRMVLGCSWPWPDWGAPLKPIRQWVGGGASPDGPALGHCLPYLLALVAALTWGVYSALLARWRHWSKDYVTSPMGFLLIRPDCLCRPGFDRKTPIQAVGHRRVADRPLRRRSAGRGISVVGDCLGSGSGSISQLDGCRHSCPFHGPALPLSKTLPGWDSWPRPFWLAAVSS